MRSDIAGTRRRAARRDPALAFTVGALALLGSGGCKTVYVPNTVNVPLLEQRHELRASLAANNAQVAYAVTDHVGLMANGFLESDDVDRAADSGQAGSGYLFEGGAGYFTSLPGHVVAETYGGVGLGHVQHDNWETSGGVRSDYSFEASGLKLFLQPSIGITRSWFDAALSVRAVALRAVGTVASNYPEARLREDDLLGLDQHTWGFVEPAVTVRAGWKWVKGFVQLGRSFKLNDAEINRRESFLTVGLHLTFADRFRAVAP